VTPDWSSVIGFVRLVPWDDSQPSLRAGRAVIAFGGYSSSIGHDVRVALEPSSGERPVFTLASGDAVLDVPTGQAAVLGVYDDVDRATKATSSSTNMLTASANSARTRSSSRRPRDGIHRRTLHG
jgi:hypothetical protein